MGEIKRYASPYSKLDQRTVILAPPTCCCCCSCCCCSSSSFVVPEAILYAQQTQKIQEYPASKENLLNYLKTYGIGFILLVILVRIGLYAENYNFIDVLIYGSLIGNLTLTPIAICGIQFKKRGKPGNAILSSLLPLLINGVGMIIFMIIIGTWGLIM